MSLTEVEKILVAFYLKIRLWQNILEQLQICLWSWDRVGERDYKIC